MPTVLSNVLACCAKSKTSLMNGRVGFSGGFYCKAAAGMIAWTANNGN